MRRTFASSCCILATAALLLTACGSSSSQSTCTPQCSGRVCGFDGCGGTCGTCSEEHACSASGQCVDVECVRTCIARACGDDGCGGSCGTCPAGQGCNASGQCVGCTPTCATDSCGDDGCGGTCSCPAGKSCDGSGHCVASTCTPSCGGRQCGPDPTCGTSCGTCPANHACDTGGQCVLACPTGTGNCDGNEANGCETDLRASTAHCGACGRACSFANAGAACSGGSCVLTGCVAGFGDCDGDPANGCEAVLSTDQVNCGTCAHTCAASQQCVAGSCATAALPDLVPTISHTPSAPTIAGPVTFTVTVSNVGAGTAGASRVEIRIGGETVGQMYDIPALAPGTSFTVTRHVTLGTGAYTARAIADSAGSVVESNEGNNEATESFTVVTGSLSCTLITTAMYCTNGATPEINLGPMTGAQCHSQCELAMPAGGITSGCWVLAVPGDGNCYCRSGVLATGGNSPGGTCQ